AARRRRPARSGNATRLGRRLRRRRSGAGLRRSRRTRRGPAGPAGRRPLLVAAGLLAAGTPPGWADVCGDAGQVPGCVDPGAPVGDPPAPPGGVARPPWLGTIAQRDPQFSDSYVAMRERILKDGAIPAKYKLLMAMVTDAIAAHPDGVRTLANNARAAGATEPEVTEAVEVGYLFGGTAALVVGSNAFG
ncbi:carboxymuconolactone decarboxylase family protein, partial [Mycobacterium palustre]|uniref:carboxymuconolactone decarboxylase family protein n=1 Tax=Mycobacterium palustre TaxID=153971 RepID=UPI0021F38992